MGKARPRRPNNWLVPRQRSSPFQPPSPLSSRAKPRDLQFRGPQTDFSFCGFSGLASSPREEPWSYKNICLGWSGTADPSASLGMTKERVVERERTVVEGQASCWGGGDAPFPSTTALFIDRTPLCEIKKVTTS